jgi:hypothetical protein
MKNLFYVSLVAMLSLGSTGFTTVEEDLSSPDCEQLCTQVAIDVHDGAMERGKSMSEANFYANLAYASCMSNCDRPAYQPVD